MLDNIRWNVQAVLRNMHEAQVMSLFFPYIGRALIIDLRHDELEGPAIAVDGMTSGPRERIDSIKKLRPRFDTPDNLTLAPWLGPVRSLETTGALADVSIRLERIARPEAQAALDGAYRELLEAERAEVLALIRGEVKRTKTLYQR
jgi:hypothetical protein